MTVKCLRMLTVAKWNVYEHKTENVLEVFGPDNAGYCCVLQGLRAVRDISRQDGQSAVRLSEWLNWDTLKLEFLKLRLLRSCWYFLLLCSCPHPLFCLPNFLQYIKWIHFIQWNSLSAFYSLAVHEGILCFEVKVILYSLMPCVMLCLLYVQPDVVHESIKRTKYVRKLRVFHIWPIFGTSVSKEITMNLS
jgi:hypothetical protein